MSKIKKITAIIFILLLTVTCSKDEPIVQYKLTTQSIPTDGGEISPSNGTFDDGDVITIKAVPKENYKFIEWTGNASGTNNPLSLTIDSNKVISAVFEKKDTDSDGVMDDADQCSGTPSGENVDANGCSTSQKDTDGDGVMDDADQCSDTPSGASVDSDGCSDSQKDTDGDGVMDDVDQCSDTPSGASVDSNGCSDSQKDTDGDGVMDDADQCSDTPSGESVDENGCSIQLTYVPDDQFEQYLIDRDLDDILDNYVVTSNINNVSHIYIDENYTHNVSDLTGIEDFTNLQFLTVKGKSLTSLNVINNIELKEIDVSGNQISSIDVSKCTNLSDLDLGENQLSNIDVTQNLALTFLSVFDNQISTLDLAYNLELNTLYAGSNKIEDIDLSKNLKLTNLNISNNNLSSLDLGGLGHFDTLFCGNNQLTSLDISNNTISFIFDCTNNQISCIQVSQVQYDGRINDPFWSKDSDATYSIDCSNPNAGKTYVPDNNFEQALIDQGFDDIMDDYVLTANISGLTLLSLQNKNISDLKGIEDFVNLVQLFALQNNLSSIDVTNNTKLETLILDGNNLTSIDISTLNNLFALTISSNNLTTIDTSNNPNLYSLSCSYNNITSLDLSQNSKLDTFYCDNNALTSLDISNNNNLNDSTGENQFSCLNNPMQCIQVNQTQLNSIPSNWKKDASTNYSIDCSNPNAGKTYVPDDNFEQALIDLGYDDVLDDYVLTVNISELKRLIIDNRNIINLKGIEDFKGLIQLKVKSNQLTSIDLSANTALIDLSLFNNQLTSIDLNTNTALTDLDLGVNPITNIDLSANTALNSLSLMYCELTSIDLSANTTLSFLHLNNNQLTSIDISVITDLYRLNLNENPDLTCIEVNQNQLDVIPSLWDKDSSAVYALDCSNPYAGKTYIPDNNFEQALIDLGYDDVLDDYVLTANISGITGLSLNNKNVSDLTGIEDFVNLVQLFAQQNNLTSIDLTNNTRLETLILDSNKLTSIDVSTLNNLFALTISLNNLTSINTSNNPNLYTLVCSDNNITSLDLSNNFALDSFGCNNNELSSLDVSNNNNLNDSTGQNQFYCKDNPLQCIQVNQTQLNNIPSNWEKDANTNYSLNCN